MNTVPKPILLLIFDGWGYRTETENNAIAAAVKPNWDKLWAEYPHMLIDASGKAVGLPDKQMGNSEVGHMNIGAGRVIYQDLTRIDQAITDGTFKKNPALLKAIEAIKANGQALHLLGLLSAGGVHAHEHHIQEMVKLAAELGVKKIYIHAFLDGRDTPPQSAMSSLESMQQLCNSLSKTYKADIRIVSLVGRYFAMDRDKRWDRTQTAYDLIVDGKAEYHSNDPTLALTLAYTRDENDEFVHPTSIHLPNVPAVKIEDGDAVIFMNFRNDRARQLSRALTQKEFDGFERARVPQLSVFATLTHYANDIEATVAFPHVSINNGLGEWLSKQHKTQLRIAETEKYAHVTFFFNGGKEDPFEGETRVLVPSPNVATYDLKPEMSAFEITDKLVEAISKQQYDLIVVNFANADMVGHTGNFDATVKAITALDQCLGKVIKALTDVGGEALITADHGNAEVMYDPATKQPHTAHTSLLVPLVYVGHQGKFVKSQGSLDDIAPTLLSLMHVPLPPEMTGDVLLK